MGFRCSLLGHNYGDSEVEREREEQGSEVVVTIREEQTCSRCGKTKLLSENKEVTSLATRESDPGDDAQNAGGSWYGGEGEDEDMGLVVNLKEDEPGQFIWDEAAGKPVRTNPLDSQVQLRTCARCHARREVTSEKFVPGEPFLESHMPTLLEQPLYHTDGAIREEVYVWGSFVQSKMHAEGVRCVDCHDPHSLDIHTNERDLCLQCHSGETYATPDHHFHESGEPGSSCVDCHMPQETYMVVDPRRDHSFRVPRPDRSAALGTPNSCNKCHTEESTDWAMKHWEQWWGEPGEDPKQFAYALHADRAGRPESLLAALRCGSHVRNGRVLRIGNPTEPTRRPKAHERMADDILARDKPPAVGIEATVAVVAQDQIVPLGDLLRPVGIVGLGLEVGLLDGLTVNENGPAPDGNRLARQANDALDKRLLEPLALKRWRGGENDDIAPFGAAEAIAELFH